MKRLDYSIKRALAIVFFRFNAHPFISSTTVSENKGEGEAGSVHGNIPQPQPKKAFLGEPLRQCSAKSLKRYVM
jgi:hypothetical protein